MPFENAHALGGAGRTRLEHVRRRQVAPDAARGRVQHGRSAQAAMAARRGFERFYGFLGGETDQWYPDLVYDNHPVDPPGTPEDGYHLAEDIADKTIEFIRDAKAIAPDKPWFMLLLPRRRARAAPRLQGVGRQVPGQVRHGLRELPRDRAGTAEVDGHRPAGDRVVAASTRTLDVKAPHGQPWPAQDTVRPWDSLNDDEKRLFAGWPRSTPASSATPIAQIGRILDYLEESGQLDNTIIVVVSDNGASGEGGPNGSVNENKFFNGIVDTIEENLKLPRRPRRPEHLQPLPDRLGDGLQHAVQAVEALRRTRGRHRRPDDHLVAARHSGARRNSRTSTCTRSTSCRRSTTAGHRAAGRAEGLCAEPLEGVSFSRTSSDAERDTGKETQFYTMLGTRGIWHDGWKANAVHAANLRGGAISTSTAGSSTIWIPTAISCAIWPRSTRPAARNADPLVRRSRQVQRSAPRRPHRHGDHGRGSPAARGPARSVRVLSRLRSRA